MATETFLFTSESVNEGHPDKLCDQVSDAVLDACLAQDADSKVACETCTKTNMVMVFGEITTKEILKIVKENFDFRPGMISINLDLKKGGNRFIKTAAYGHFGREDADFTWEVVKPLKFDKASA
ncbi:unnamed protein product [Triticum turgidum subsp. durum]|uniref:S-adenosylmethionine synthetase N-terminal domain-containing protein n=1 Tax=Triticum turgidum subsp. durum TaxID=4567 RepID=A0A9R1QH97_TRITD|nr:unnamed protein product [Triticum turgidum subsp. durum]